MKKKTLLALNAFLLLGNVSIIANAEELHTPVPVPGREHYPSKVIERRETARSDLHACEYEKDCPDTQNSSSNQNAKK